MADPKQEADSATLLIREAIVRLRTADPEHELLQFAENYEYMKPSATFLRRYGGERVAACFRDTDYATAAMYTNYYNELLKALGEE
jgi:hypothetical protein